MKRWLWAAAACLVGTSAANAEYAIIRVWLNKNVGQQAGGQFGGMPGGFIGGPPGGFRGGPPGGMIGGPPGGMVGGPPGGAYGNRGGPPGGMTGGPPAGVYGNRGSPGPGGRPPGGAGGGLSVGPYSSGGPPGGFAGGGPPGPGGGPPGGFAGGGPPGAGPPGGGAAGFVGGGPGMGFVGGGFIGFAGGQQQQEQFVLNPDDYVTACVPIHGLDVIQAGTTFGFDPAGKPINIGVPGNFHFRTKYGTTWIDTSIADISIDIRGYDKQRIDRYPDPQKMLQHNQREPKQYSGPDGQVRLAEWCLEVGLPDEAIKILDTLAAADPKAKELYKPATKTAVDAYAQIAPILRANVERMDSANQWKERLGYPIVKSSAHYALVYQENVELSAERRLGYLEDTFKTVYVWFALKGKALPAPTEKLVGVIVGDSNDYRRYRDTFEATNLTADGFHARRENLAVFSARRLDKASINFEQLIKDVNRKFRTETLFGAREAKDLPRPQKKNPQPNDAKTYEEYARASTLALVDACLQEEAERASASHEGTRQIFAEAGLLPRNVLAPEWVRFGISALFESPKGAFPGSAKTLKVAMYPGGGGPHWAYMRYFEELRDSKYLTERNAPEMFLETVLDRPFRSARKAEQLEKALSKKTEEGDSKAVRSEELYNRARTLSWSLVYFLAKARFNEFVNFLEELAKLPRDAELDGEAVIGAFGRAYGLGGGNIAGTGIDEERFLEIGLEWWSFMGKEQSPSKKLKLDDLTVIGGGAGGGAGMPGGGPGFPGGPGMGPGFPGGPGGPGMGPGGGPGYPGGPGGGRPGPGGGARPGGGGRPPGG